VKWRRYWVLIGDYFGAMLAAGVVAPATAEAVLSIKWFKKVIDKSIFLVIFCAMNVSSAMWSKSS